MCILSIILPVYNVERFIGLCLDSLYLQDMNDDEFEIICVNDGSSDNSSQVIQEYQGKHTNIILVEQSNKGVCAARNKGFSIAKGKYVWFIDPDDMIREKCVPQIIFEMEKAKADIFEMNYMTCSEEETKIPENQIVSVDGENRPGSSGSGCLSVCLSAYLRDNGIQFDERLSYGEDYLWAFQTKFRKHKSVYTNQSLYVYRQRTASAMHSRNLAKAEKKMNDMLLLYQIYGKEYERCKKEQLPEDMLLNVRQRQMICVEAALLCLAGLGKNRKEIREKLLELREKNMYPYKLMWWHLKAKELAPLKSRLVTFLFPFQPYYMMICSLLSLRRKAHG